MFIGNPFAPWLGGLIVTKKKVEVVYPIWMHVLFPPKKPPVLKLVVDNDRKE